LSSSEVSFAQQEFGLVLDQIDSTSQQTRFNGVSLLTGGGGEVVVGNNNKDATTPGASFQLNDVDSGFAGTLNAAGSSGFIFHEFGSSNQIDVTVDGGNITLNVGGETFTGDSMATAGGVLVLTSEDTSENVLAFDFDAASVGSVDTDAEMQAELKNLLANSTVRVGYSEELTFGSSGLANISVDFTGISQNQNVDVVFNRTSILNLNASSGVVQGSLESTSDVNVTGGQGNFSISMVVNDETFSASSVSFTDGGVLTLTSERDPGNRIGLNMAGTISNTFLSAPDQSQADTVAAQLRILMGFGTTAQGDTNVDNPQTGNLSARNSFQIGNAEAAFGLSSSATGALGFGGTLTAAGSNDQSQELKPVLNNTNTQGFIDGVVQSVDVTQNGRAFDVSMVVGAQTFVAQGFNASDGGQMNLISTSDNDNVISFNLANSAATDGNLNTLPQLQVSMERWLGLDSVTGGAPARFQSASANNDGFNGFEMGVDQTVKASSATTAGTYALSYDASNQEFKLTDGVTTMTEKATSDTQQTVQFTNGITLSLGESTEFDFTQDMTQTVFTVGEGTGFNANFQVSEVAGDDLEIQLNSTTVDALGLSGVNINSATEARDAQEKINLAINTVQIGLATIGAQQSRFDFIQSNIATQVENTRAARGTFYDVDTAQEMIDFTRANTLMQSSISMMAQANQMPQQLLRLIG
jgi:flagellin-like hook-associated protein FlgL